MSNTIFTDAGRALIASCLADNQLLDITELVFADVPGLNTSATPDPAAPLPPAGQIVHRAIPQKGLFDPTTAVFSTVIDADTGDFYINYMGLLSGDTLVAVCVMPRHYKYKTSEFKAGNSLVKNFAIELQNVSQLTGIIIPAPAWMWDFDDRYARLDHNHDEDYEPLGEVGVHNGAASPHPGKFEAAGAVNTHNGAASPHPGKFDTAGAAETAVNTHNGAATPHPGKFEASGAVSAHNSASTPHPGKFDSSGAAETAVNTHNGAATPHPGKFEISGAVNTHNESASPHPGKFEVAGAVNTHNGAASPHPGKFETAGAVSNHNQDAEAHGGIVNNKANKNFDNLTLETALANLGFVGSLSQNGYQKLPGGLIVQWGLSLYDDGSLTSRSVVFPITYPNEALVVFGCDIGALSYHYSFASLSPTGFDAHFAAGTGAWGFNWLSVGY